MNKRRLHNLNKRRFKKELKKFLESNGGVGTWESYKRNLDDSLKEELEYLHQDDASGAITGAFIWDYTDEGQSFWRTINDKWWAMYYG